MKYLVGISEDRVARRIRTAGRVSMCRYDGSLYLTDTYFLVKLSGAQDYRKIMAEVLKTAGRLPAADGESVGEGANKDMARFVASYFDEVTKKESKEAEITNWLYMTNKANVRVVETSDGLRFFDNDLIELFNESCSVRLVEKSNLGLLVFSWAGADIGMIVEFRVENIRLPGEKGGK